jgi:hypothetical protein
MSRLARVFGNRAASATAPHPPNRCLEISKKRAKGAIGRDCAGNQHIICFWPAATRQHHLGGRAQAPLGTVANHGIADFPAGGKPHPDPGVVAGARSSWGSLQNETGLCRSATGGSHTKKIGSSF